MYDLGLLVCFDGTVDRSGVHENVRKRATLLEFFLFIIVLLPCFTELLKLKHLHKMYLKGLFLPFFFSNF